MRTPINCPAFNKVKEKLHDGVMLNRHFPNRKLTMEEALEVDDYLNLFCVYPEYCGHREQCRFLDNRLTFYLPLYIEIPKYKHNNCHILPQASARNILQAISGY